MHTKTNEEGQEKAREGWWGGWRLETEEGGVD